MDNVWWSHGFCGESYKWGDSTAHLQIGLVEYETSQLKFKTLGKLLIILEEIVEKHLNLLKNPLKLINT